MDAMRLRPYKLRRAHMLQNSISSWMPGGLFDAEGHVWKKERRIVAPALNKSNLRDYFPSIKLVATRLVNKWEENNKQEEVVASTDIPSSALDVIALSMLGRDFDSLNHPEYPLAVASRNMFRVTFERALSPVPYWKIPFIGQNIDGGRYYSTMILDAVRSLVQDCRKRIENNNRQEEGQQQATRRTFLEKAVGLTDGEGSKLDEDRMVGNLVQVMLAGTDTSSDTTTFCLWELAKDLELQDELYKENTQLDKNLEDLTMDDVHERFPRHWSFVYEILRVKGPTPFLLFEPTEPVEFHGETILPGTILCALTRSPGTKADAEVPSGPNGESSDQFCPRRWLVPIDNDDGALKSGDDDPAARVKVIRPSNKFGGYMAFGYGPRLCPGMQYGETFVLTMLIHILRNFEVRVAEDHPPMQYASRLTETFDGEISFLLKPRPQTINRSSC